MRNPALAIKVSLSIISTRRRGFSVATCSTAVRKSAAELASSSPDSEILAIPFVCSVVTPKAILRSFRCGGSKFLVDDFIFQLRLPRSDCRQITHPGRLATARYLVSKYRGVLACQCWQIYATTFLMEGLANGTSYLPSAYS